MYQGVDNPWLVSHMSSQSGCSRLWTSLSPPSSRHNSLSPNSEACYSAESQGFWMKGMDLSSSQPLSNVVHTNNSFKQFCPPHWLWPPKGPWEGSSHKISPSRLFCLPNPCHACCWVAQSFVSYQALRGLRIPHVFRLEFVANSEPTNFWQDLRISWSRAS